MQKITTLVLPVAGLGKRLLPLTARTPKNLLLVNGKPLIEYVLDEAVVSGIKKVVLIVNPRQKGQFRAYVRKNARRFPGISFFTRVQGTPGGNGHAIVQAYDLIAGKPFAVRFCDDILIGNPPALSSLLDLFYRYRAPIVLLEKIPKKTVSRYGVVGVGKPDGRKVYRIDRIVEKPKVKDAPSNLIIVGGYVLTPNIVRNLKMLADTLPLVADDALQLAAGLQIELITGNKVYGWEFPGRRLDCGTLEKLQKAESILSASGNSSR